VNDAAIVGRVLREYHLRGIEPSALRRVGGAAASGVVTYLVGPDEAAPWVVRACREDAPVPVHVGGAPAMSMLDWLMAQAGTLDCLEVAGYPAPRVIRTHSGDPVGLDGAWLTLATSFVEGPVIRPSLAQLRMLGVALGRLHALDIAGEPGGGPAGERSSGPARGSGSGLAGEPGRALWYPEVAIPATLARLDAVEALVPEGLRDLYAQLRQTALTVQAGLSSLPRGMVHGDAWPGNAVQSGPDTVTLIDWETGGLGLPVLDLGACLIESLLDAQPSGSGPAASGSGPAASGSGPAAWLVEPDEDRIAAVARGYASQRVVGAAERALLPAAVRFGACYVGAIHLHQALADGVRGASMEARLERLRNRVSVSEAVARLAAPHLAGGAQLAGGADFAGGADLAGGPETVR
jgi:Ser/Thr protein kinase RdoA (MazF antagonist)